MASLEYAVAVLGAPLILVLGHEACGAVDATIKSLKDDKPLPGHMPSLVTGLAPAVKAVAGQPGDTLDNATRRNVVDTVAKLKPRPPSWPGGRTGQTEGGWRHLPAKGWRGRDAGLNGRPKKGRFCAK